MAHLKLFLLFLCCFLALFSCASHYQKIKVDQVELYLKKKDAKEVKIAYSLDQFTPRKTKKISVSTWMALVPTTEEFSYFYIVDGTVYLPKCSYLEKDDFGSENCIYQPDR